MKKGRATNKRALSPVIATILLVLLVLVLALLIFLWARGLISEQIEKSGQAIENVCPSVNFEVNIIRNSTGNFLEAVNRGSVFISAFELKLVSGGDSETHELSFGADAGESISQEIGYNLDSYDELIIYPILLGSVKGGVENKQYTCTDIGKKITL